MRQHSEEGRTRPHLLVAIILKLFLQNVPVARFGQALLSSLYESSSFATVRDALSCRASLFCNTVAKFTLAERFQGSACGRK